LNKLNEFNEKEGELKESMLKSDLDSEYTHLSKSEQFKDTSPTTTTPYTEINLQNLGS
jgi:hypothetical protein